MESCPWSDLAHRKQSTGFSTWWLLGICLERMALLVQAIVHSDTCTCSENRDETSTTELVLQCESVVEWLSVRIQCTRHACSSHNDDLTSLKKRSTWTSSCVVPIWGKPEFPGRIRNVFFFLFFLSLICSFGLPVVCLYLSLHASK